MSKTIENLRKRKASGGVSQFYRSRRAFEADGYAAETLLGETKLVQKRVRGGNVKMSLRRVNHSSVFNPSTNKSSKAKILKVLRNSNSKDFERRGVITRGAIIETDLGEARVVSRPGQDGVVNSVLIK